MSLETSRRKIIARLEREGWANQGGGEHDLYVHPDQPAVIAVPRHRELSPGVARDIKKRAGW